MEVRDQMERPTEIFMEVRQQCESEGWSVSPFVGVEEA